MIRHRELHALTTRKHGKRDKDGAGMAENRSHRKIDYTH
jgi:hypothetical protein